MITAIPLGGYPRTLLSLEYRERWRAAFLSPSNVCGLHLPEFNQAVGVLRMAEPQHGCGLHLPEQCLR